MWGNRTGWTIAAVLAVLIGVGVWQLADVNRLTPPTGFSADPAVTRPLATEVPADAVYKPAAPAAGDAAGRDAGPLYRRAIEAAAADESAFRGLAEATDPATIERAAAVVPVLDAAALPATLVFGRQPDIYATYRPPPESLAALADLADALVRAGLLRANGPGDDGPAAARRDFVAAFALGRALFDERLRYDEAVAGLTAMDTAAAGLRELAKKQGDAKRAGVLDAYVRSADTVLTTRLLRPWNVVASRDLDSIDRHAGDVFALAGPATQERLWRVEAVLRLGQYKFNAVRAADQLAVPRRLRELRTGEKDPVVLAAIDAAEGLTIEQYRLLP